MADKRYNVLLAGESWMTTATHITGFDQFSTVTFLLGAEPLIGGAEGVSVRPALHACARNALKVDGCWWKPRRSPHLSNARQATLLADSEETLAAEVAFHDAAYA
jgi:hypothetical protein